MNTKSLMATILTSVLIANIGLASAVKKGRKIFEEANERNDGFGDSVVQVQMILKTRSGKESKREFILQTLEGSDDKDKTKLVFVSPKYIKKTALLTHIKTDEDDKQWLFLPASGRTKRISSSNQSGSFVGSEFSYEDLRAPVLDKYTYKYIKNEKIGKQNYFVIERYPASKDSGYTKQIVWLDKKHYRMHKIEYYDRKKSHLKTLIAKNYKKYLNKYWRSHFQEVKNHQTGKSTRLKIKKIEFRQGLSKRDFLEQSLKK